MKKILFIINPNSGIDRVKALKSSIETHLNTNIFEFEITYTQYAKHGQELAKKGVEKGFDIIVAVGGDGSVNDVINGIYGSEAILGIIPKGSGNGLARSLYLPLNTEKAIRLLNHLNIRKIDLGEAQGRLFASNVGVGFDTVVTNAFGKSKRRGLMAYLSIIMKTIWHYPVQEWTLEVDGNARKEKAFMLTVANAFQLGYGFKISPKAKLDDGYLDLVVIRKFPKILAASVALRAFTGKILQSPYVKSEKAKKILIRHPKLNMLQIDGEALPCTNPLEIKILPCALKVLA